MISNSSEKRDPSARPADENLASNSNFCAGLVRDDSAGFNQEAAHTVFGMPGFIRAAWLYKVLLSSLHSIPTVYFPIGMPSAPSGWSGGISGSLGMIWNRLHLGDLLGNFLISRLDDMRYSICPIGIPTGRYPIFDLMTIPELA